MPLTHVGAFRYLFAGTDGHPSLMDNLSAFVTSEDSEQDVHLQYYPPRSDAVVKGISCDRQRDDSPSFRVQQRGIAPKPLNSIKVADPGRV